MLANRIECLAWATVLSSRSLALLSSGALAVSSSCAIAGPGLATGTTQSAPTGTPATSAPSASAELPVREVACFKDGHAFVIREGTRKVDADGRVVLENLPAPVLGTFWPYATGGARVVSATASKDRVMREHTALDLRESLEANMGAAVVLFDTNNERIEGQLIGLPAKEPSPPDTNGGPGTGPATGPRSREPGRIVLLKVAEGVRAIPFERVRDVTFKDRDSRTVRSEELVDRLTLRVENGGAQAAIGLAYVQKGLRWIPAYKVDIDGQGKAAVKLEATLVNDLIDLDDVTVNLVVGVPRFEFAGQVDPIGLQQTVAEMGRRMQPYDPFSNMASNAIMTQSAYIDTGDRGSAGAPEVQGAQNNEDLFVYAVQHVTLHRGDRMVLPIVEFALTYRDVYTLDVDVDPPLDVQAQLGNGRNANLANALARAKVVHAARLQNDSNYPLTTAPALLFSGGRVLAQSLMTYTPKGASTDLELASALDVQVESDSKETARVPNAMTWNSHSYGRIDMVGTVELTNRKPQAVDLEVRQLVLGQVDSANADAKFQQKNAASLWTLPHRPEWWSTWSWPYWWFRWNGVGEMKWTLRLEPGKSTKLESKWHYFWD